ncbi:MULTISPECIES: CGNR zinc finger domain-containing protein [unclassified Leifsonia]|uniref:CGNR zinc finger domain-containing protein n=1 Tax=unclassified Leifsonia TaxID=2663824 RepID=UPI0003714166|nr:MULTISPECIES: ABATE domain-containing protein [unclassified Leifsonia]TDP98607.1 putative RNA-binding Zn ribbon-like protein [Leifsonia sp. 115AMFTsu3.1]
MHAFPCGTSALDFVGTLRARRNDVPTEKLGSPEALDAWFLEAGLMDRSPRATTADLEVAVELREAVYRVVHARMMGAPFAEDDLRVLNSHAAGRPITLQLHESGTIDRASEIAEGLSQIARQTVEIVGGAEGDVLRECGRPECTQVYLDHSRGHRREWCSMKTCGNRMKATAFRARQKQPAATA